MKRDSEIRREVDQQRAIEWLKVWLIAEVWNCGDELDGICTQPQIVRSGPNLKTRGRTHEVIWEGTFINEASHEERQQQDDELREAAAMYGIPLEEKYGYHLYGRREETL